MFHYLSPLSVNQSAPGIGNEDEQARCRNELTKRAGSRAESGPLWAGEESKNCFRDSACSINRVWGLPCVSGWLTFTMTARFALSEGSWFCLEDGCERARSRIRKRTTIAWCVHLPGALSLSATILTAMIRA